MDAYTSWTTLNDSQLTREKVNLILSRIPDDLWVSAACLDKLVDDIETQEALLQLGLARTASAVERCKDALVLSSAQQVSESSKNGTEATMYANQVLVAHFKSVKSDAHLCDIRSMLLERLDKLNTYTEISKVPLNDYWDVEESSMDEWEDDPWGENAADGGAKTNAGDTSKAGPSIQTIIPLSFFLTHNLVSSACLLASSQQFEALHVLRRLHGRTLWPYRFQILETIPEHVHPSSFQSLLPAFDIIAARETNPPDMRESRPERDWSETDVVQTSLQESGIRTHTSASASRDAYTCRVSPLSEGELSDWYKSRVDEIVSSTGLIDIALELIQHGASQGITGLDEVGEDLSLLSRLAYDAPQGTVVPEDWTLQRWYSMDPPSVLCAYLAHSTPDSLAQDMSRLVLPYLFVVESRAERAGKPDPQLAKRLLYDYVLSASLEMVAAIFEASKPTLPIAQRLIRDDEDVVRIALSCLYGCDRLDLWSVMSSIFECMPAWDVADDDADEADTTLLSLGNFVTPTTTRPRITATDLLLFFKPLPRASLSRALDVLDLHLEAGEILSRWSVPAPLQWFLRSNANINEQRAWANRMARRAGGEHDKLATLDDWEWLLDDMFKLCGQSEIGIKGAFGLLSRGEVSEIFFGGLLSSGQFDIAKDVLRTLKGKLQLDDANLEDICLKASREFYDNASSGNYNFGDMQLAYNCLDVLPMTENLRREREFIEATSRISSFNVTSRVGIPISPIEIRLTKDRLSLVSRVLSSNNDAYKHTEVILDLVRKLGFRGDASAEIKTLAMLADTALQAEDFDRAYSLTEQMVKTVVQLRSSHVADPGMAEAVEVCWVACFQLGRQPEFKDVSRKLLLLGYALELCPSESIHNVLTAWRKLANEDIEAREEELIEQPSGTAHHRSRIRDDVSSNVTSSLRARLQDFHMPSPPLLSTPDAAALASRTFKSVAASFPFSVGHRSHSRASESERSNSTRRDVEEVSAQASRVLSKGIGWLIGADDEM